MTTEIKLLLPNSLVESLAQKAKNQGVSLEALCASLLEEKNALTDPTIYSSLSNQDIKLEMKKIMSSDLGKEEKNRRIKILEHQVLRFIR